MSICKDKFSHARPGPMILSTTFYLLLFLLYASMAYCAVGNERIIFLHHSTGGNLYSQGGVASWIADYNSANGTTYQITERAYPNSPYPWSNYPYDYWNLWVNQACNSTDPDIECMHTLTQNFDVIIFKHCFPGADVLAEIADMLRAVGTP